MFGAPWRRKIFCFLFISCNRQYIYVTFLLVNKIKMIGMLPSSAGKLTRTYNKEVRWLTMANHASRLFIQLVDATIKILCWELFAGNSRLLHSMLPKTFHLVCCSIYFYRSCKHEVEKKNLDQAKRISSSFLSEHPHCISMWKVYHSYALCIFHGKPVLTFPLRWLCH